MNRKNRDFNEDVASFVRGIGQAGDSTAKQGSPSLPSGAKSRKSKATVSVLLLSVILVMAALWFNLPLGKAEPVDLGPDDVARIAAAKYPPPVRESIWLSPIMNGKWKQDEFAHLDMLVAAYKADPRRYDFAVNAAKDSWTADDPAEKTVYLTFDDGPSPMTGQILSILADNKVKATFFVTCQYPDSFHYVRQAYDAGHTIALHTGSHDYARIYASEAAYFGDLVQVGKMVEDQIGYIPCFVRFPGGASNTISGNYSKGIMSRLADQLVAKGYQYYDWNASTGDGGTVDRRQAYDNAIKANGEQSIVILCHDTPAKQSTADALPDIIKFYKEQGYMFKPIDRDTPITHQAIAN